VAVAGVVGLVLGSFLNVVVYRVPRRLSVVRPPSFCPRCRQPVRPRDNVPVASWLLLGGHCRFCGQPISVRYPLVEAGTGLLFVLVALAVGPHWAVVGLCASAATVATSATIELDGLRPPPPVPLVGGGLSFVLLLGAAVVDRRWAHLAGAAAGLVVATALAAVTTRWAQPGSGQRRLRGQGWSLLPIGVVLGWAGPAGTAAGIGVLGVLVLLLPAARRPAPEARPAGIDAAGISSAAALSCVAAVIAALVAGPALGT